MNAYGFGHAADPRAEMSADELRDASIRAAPEVARRSGAAEGMGLAAGVLGVAVLGGVTLLGMSHARTAKPAATTPAAAVAPAPTSAAKPAPIAVAAPAPAPARFQSAPLPAEPLAATAPTTVAPVLILDQTAPTPPALTAAAPAAVAGAAAAAKNAVYFTPDEQFAGRAAEQGVPTSRASRLANPGQIVAQGTLIAAVLETALNSDLPGYARALVSQDVRSFDGKRVLIPRGSRLVGEYKSALAIGQSRAFIVWTRVLRPDGVSVQLGSPATDPLGQAGLSGKVNRHFLQRFGGAILLTAINGVATAAAGGSSLVLSTSGDSSGASTALQSSAKISPTIRVPQGTPIQVFAARDLDFSDAGA